jgi:hypothetical protein
MDKGIFVTTTAAEETTLAELFERYQREVVPTKKSQAAIKSRIKIVASMTGFFSVAALTPRILAGYRDARQKKVKGHTVRKELQLINGVLKHAQREWSPIFRLSRRGQGAPATRRDLGAALTGGVPVPPRRPR